MRTLKPASLALALVLIGAVSFAAAANGARPTCLVSNKAFGTAMLDGGGAGRVLRVDVGVNVAIASLTITGGSAVVGGGILNDGSVTLIDSTLSGNTASQSGGGVFNDPGAALSLVNSTVDGNTALQAGGGILNQGGSVALSGSTVSGNTAGSGSTVGFGGGIWNDPNGSMQHRHR